MGAATSTAYLSNLETIPYSKRTRMILIPRQIEKAFSDLSLQDFKEEYEGKVLPATHPMSVRVGMIAQNVIDALQRDLIRQGRERYLEHVNWTVFVVDDPSICDEWDRFPGVGSIILSTNLLMELNSEDEIAAIIGRQVAYTVARTVSETLTKCARLFFLELLFTEFFGESAMRNKISFPMICPLFRKFELEADYIGLLLMASAGYDPRVGVKLMEKEAKYEAEDSSYWTGFCRASLKKRFQLLSQAQDEAMDLYRKRDPHVMAKQMKMSQELRFQYHDRAMEQIRKEYRKNP